MSGIGSFEPASLRDGGQPDADLFRQRAAAAQATLPPAARRVISFIEQNRAETLASSAVDLAARIGTSDATVVRAVQALGFAGLGELRKALVPSLTHGSTPAEQMRQTLEDVGESTDRAIELVMNTHLEALDALRSKLARRQIAAAVAALHKAQRIAVFGIGPSAPLANYVSIQLGRTGRQAYVLNATGIALADQMLSLRLGDAVLALAYTQPYREIAAVFAEGRRLGMRLVLVTDRLDSKLALLADVVVPARRGRAERVALHGATLVVLEAVVLGLTVCNRDGALVSLERLSELREAVGAKRREVA